MLKKFFFLLAVLALAACTATEPEPYQADRKPEDRTEYNGLEGALQQQKDQGYLLSKELSEKCENAKIDLAVAESQSNTKDADKQKDIIAKTCR